METIARAGAMQRMALELRRRGKHVGFVPTMGALHEGHLSLVRRARRDNQVVVVSVFVNPTQFGPNEDYRNYPRDLQRDTRLLQQEDVNYLFAPPVEEIYPPGFQTSVFVERVSAPLEGEHRPGHFHGVASVVLKLLNLVQPRAAYFGQKDAQQVAVLRQMVSDLNLPVEIVVCPIVREPDGLALSSRNAYLDAAERQAARVLYQTLVAAKELLEASERRAAVLVEKMREQLAREPRARIDYVAAVDAESFQPVEFVGERPTGLLLAVWIGRARLIDNMLVERRDGRLEFHF